MDVCQSVIGGGSLSCAREFHSSETPKTENPHSGTITASACILLKCILVYCFKFHNAHLNLASPISRKDAIVVDKGSVESVLSIIIKNSISLESIVKKLYRTMGEDV